MYPSDAAALRNSDLFQRYWYYSIELLPDCFTPGAGHLNFGLTRHLFSRCAVEKRRVLDIGTMESAIPILAKRRGAAHAVGVDIAPFDDKIRAVQHYLGVSFDYFSGQTHASTVPFLKDRGLVNFDVVVLSGVLYHCFGPLHTLAVARSLLRTGGILIIETFAALSDEFAMYFNKAGMFTPDVSSYFLMTPPLIDYVCRYYKLAPLDCVYGQTSEIGPYRCARVAVACRAVNDVIAEQGDRWMSGATNIVDYLTLFDWGIIDTSGSAPVEFTDAGDNAFVRPDTGTCDIFGKIRQTAPMQLTPEMARIHLADVY